MSGRQVLGAMGYAIVKRRDARRWISLAAVATSLLLARSALAADTSTSDLGQAAYTSHCAACHGVTFGGTFGPPLSGALFVQKWQNKSAASLREVINDTG